MTTETAVATRSQGDIMEAVIAKGDLSKLTPEERARYYVETCRSMGLNPLTQPFQYITLNQRLTLYATRTTTDQLRNIHHVNLTIVSREVVQDVYVVTARATMPDGRVDESIGAVTIGGLKGDALANGMMKSETKAKRRVTLSIVGLGMLDESELETIPNAQRVTVDRETGEILNPAAALRPAPNGTAPSPTPQHQPEPTGAHCWACGCEIVETWDQGKKYSPAVIIKGSQKRHGEACCFEHASLTMEELMDIRDTRLNDGSEIPF